MYGRGEEAGVAVVVGGAHPPQAVLRYNATILLGNGSSRIHLRVDPSHFQRGRGGVDLLSSLSAMQFNGRGFSLVALDSHAVTCARRAAPCLSGAFRFLQSPCPQTLGVARTALRQQHFSRVWVG